MRKTLRRLSALLVCLLLCVQAGCAEGIDLVDEWFVMPLAEHAHAVLSRTEDGFKLEGLPHTVTVEDNSMRITQGTEGKIWFSGDVYYDETDYSVFVMEPQGDPKVLFLERFDKNQWNLYMQASETVLITPTQIIDADGKWQEYYDMNERLFIVDSNGYDKFSIEVLTDDILKLINLRTAQNMLLIRTID